MTSQPPTSYKPPGMAFPGISQAIVLRGSGVLVSSGMVPVDESGEMVTGDFGTQVVAVYENIRRALSAAGFGFEQIARLVTYVTDYDPSMIAVTRKVRSRYLSKETPPASVLISAAALYDPRARIEVEFIAVVP